MLYVLLANGHCVEGLAVDATHETVGRLVALHSDVSTSSSAVAWHKVVVHLLELIVLIFLLLVDDLAV